VSESEATTVVFTKTYGRYRVEFGYDPGVVAILKAAVPGAMRRWIKRTTDENGVSRGGFWEASTDWVGPLASAFVNAGIRVIGLNHANIRDWFDVFSAPMPTSPSGGRAYAKGFCKSCESVPHRSGGVECEDCYRQRLIFQHHVKAALAEAGVTRIQRRCRR
jgi:hypothetical protein